MKLINKVPTSEEVIKLSRDFTIYLTEHIKSGNVDAMWSLSASYWVAEIYKKHGYESENEYNYDVNFVNTLTEKQRGNLYMELFNFIKEAKSEINQ